MSKCAKCGAVLEAAQCTFCRFINPTFEVESTKVSAATAKEKRELEEININRFNMLRNFEQELLQEINQINKKNKRAIIRIMIGLLFLFWFFNEVHIIPLIIALMLLVPAGIRVHSGFSKLPKLRENLKATEAERFSLMR